ncbi:MAG: helix-turn-helix transcriptional regulator [Acidobacteria bacterium]|nr:helix-turn-helix transcriptional regulator [Acidobacteriota bacterium]
MNPSEVTKLVDRVASPVRLALVAAGITNRAAAKDVGITEGRVSEICRGARRAPDPDEKAALAALVGKSVAVLFPDAGLEVAKAMYRESDLVKASDAPEVALAIQVSIEILDRVLTSVGVSGSARRATLQKAAGFVRRKHQARG